MLLREGTIFNARTAVHRLQFDKHVFSFYRLSFNWWWWLWQYIISHIWRRIENYCAYFVIINQDGRFQAVYNVLHQNETFWTVEQKLDKFLYTLFCLTILYITYNWSRFAIDGEFSKCIYILLDDLALYLWDFTDNVIIYLLNVNLVLLMLLIIVDASVIW